MAAISITALSDAVGIVHIPIHLAESTSTRLYWTVENASAESSEFFNVTSNRLEIAVFASIDLINDQWIDTPESDIKISSTWRVFEISSGDVEEVGNYDSPHLRHVSAPLSRAGIPILYQSSYYTDFLLVKESDFDRTASIFAAQGWRVDPTVQPNRRRSQLLSPTTSSPGRTSPSHSPSSPHNEVQHSIPEITVLPSPLGCIGFSPSMERSTAERIRQLVVWPEMAKKSWVNKRNSLNGSSPAIDRSLSSQDTGFGGIHTPDSTPPSSPKASFGRISSSTQPESDDRLTRRPAPQTPRQSDGRPFLSYTRTEDGASLITESRILRSMFGKSSPDGLSSNSYEGGEGGAEFDLILGDEDDDDLGDEGEGDLYLSDDEGERNGGYVTDRTELGLSADIVDDDSASEVDFSDLRPSTGIPRDLDLDDHAPTGQPLGSVYQTPSAITGKRARPLSLPMSPLDSPLSVLSTLSPIPIAWCSDISLIDSDGRPRQQKRSTLSLRSAVEMTDSVELSDFEIRRGDLNHGRAPKGRGKRCLQLDMRGVDDEDGVTAADEVYHMDKSGLVTLFSNLLNSKSIRMLYSSTFHTANILVEARDVARAQMLLERG